MPDTACRKSLIGEAVLGANEQNLKAHGQYVKRVPAEHKFRFGNAAVLETLEAAIIPLGKGGELIKVQVVILPDQGMNTPLLCPRSSCACCKLF